MNNHEDLSLWEFASEEELRRLYDNTVDLLKKHGTDYIDPSAKYYGEEKSPYGPELLPITDRPPLLNLELGLDEVAKLSPRAVEALNLAGRLEVLYIKPYYEPLNNHPDSGKQFQHPRCAFDIPQPEDSVIRAKHFSVFLEADNTATCIKFDEPRDQPRMKSLEDWIEAVQLERSLGLNEITAEECEALEEIVDGLAKRA